MSTHLVNDPFDAVDEMLDGIVGSNADRVALTISGRGLYSTVRPPVRRVAIVAGGGSGHEPGFLGWVGPGFADGVAVGNIFASPSAEPVLEIVHELRPEAGVLFLFGNYEGDIMNFGLASAILADEGVATRTVLLTDDVASAPPDHIERRRGVAGGVIVHKIVGALADEGASLDDVAEVAVPPTPLHAASAWHYHPVTCQPLRGRPSSSLRARSNLASGSTASLVWRAVLLARRTISPINLSMPCWRTCLL